MIGSSLILGIGIGVVVASIIWLLLYLQMRGRLTEKGVELATLQTEMRGKQELMEQEQSHFAALLEAEKTKSVERQRDVEQAFEVQIQALEGKFTALAEEITQKRVHQLTESNHTGISSLLTPLREAITKMEAQMRTSSLEAAKYTTALGAQIQHLEQHTTEIGSKADSLAEALRAKSKMQGNWGEMILQQLLEKQGLMEHVSFEVQKLVRDGEGGRLYPDCVLELPGEKALVIDSKVSLTDYAQYFEEKEEEKRAVYYNQHLRSIETHIKELAKKEYPKFLQEHYRERNEERTALDLVVMFVPIPGALALAYEADPALFDKAMKQGVLLTSTHTLRAGIWVIHNLWAQQKQERHMEEIITHATNLLDRVSDFYQEFQKIEGGVQNVEKAYDNARRKLMGNQGVVKSAQKIQALGVKGNPKKSLPATEEDEREV